MYVFLHGMYIQYKFLNVILHLDTWVGGSYPLSYNGQDHEEGHKTQNDVVKLQYENSKCVELCISVQVK